MSQTDVADGRWHHVAYTTDGEVGNFFVDGVREGSHATDYEFQENFRWSLGQEFDDARPSDYLKGLLDDVRIYNRILQTTKSRHYTKPTPIGSSQERVMMATPTLKSSVIFSKPAKSSILKHKTPTPSASKSATPKARPLSKYFRSRLKTQMTPPNGITLGPDSVSKNSKKGYHRRKPNCDRPRFQ